MTINLHDNYVWNFDEAKLNNEAKWRVRLSDNVNNEDVDDDSDDFNTNDDDNDDGDDDAKDAIFLSSK